MSVEIEPGDLAGWLRMMVQLRNGKTPDGMVYSCLEEYVLKNGRAFESIALTPLEQRIVKSTMARASWPSGYCYDNARRLTRKSRHAMRYVEGYATSGILPVQHAWCELNGKVVDVTWHHWDGGDQIVDRYAGMGLIEDNTAYYGVVFEPEILDRYPTGSLIDNWRERWPLLRAEASASTR